MLPGISVPAEVEYDKNIRCDYVQPPRTRVSRGKTNHSGGRREAMMCERQTSSAGALHSRMHRFDTTRYLSALGMQLACLRDRALFRKVQRLTFANARSRVCEMMKICRIVMQSLWLVELRWFYLGTFRSRRASISAPRWARCRARAQ